MTFRDKTKEFVEALLKEDYDKAIDHFAMERELAEGTDTEAMKKELADFRELIVKNFGTELSYSFMEAEKRFSTREEENIFTA